ncbi:MAG: flippase-like domain-containing protein [Oscillospiraceae bacterium]|nr:flippase-like domain-containing protein [Candidatus Equicaccousia limihippi]
MKKMRWSVVFIACVFLILVGYVFFVDDPEKIYAALKESKPYFLILAAICMVGYWICEALCQFYILRSCESRLKFRQIVRVTMIGQLFNCITPSASGGQPMQAYVMNKYGVSVGEATCSLLMRFAVYQTVMVLYTFIILLFKLSYFTQTISAFSSLSVIGFTVNLVVLVVLLLCCFYPNLCVKIVQVIINLGAKIKLVKNKEKIIDRLDKEVENFNSTFRSFKGGFKQLGISALFAAVQLTLYFMVPFFICQALSVNINFFDSLALAAFTFLLSSFVPLPGGSGGAEGGFLLFFGGQFDAAGKSVAVAILLWRIMTFYLPILCGSVFYLTNRSKGDKKAEDL